MRKVAGAVAITVLAGFFWGTSFPAIGYGVGQVNPYAFLFLRFAITAAIAVAAVILFCGADFSLLRRRNIWVLGLANGLAFTLQYAGQTLTTAGRAALLVNLNIIIVAFLSFLIFKEKFGRYKTAAVPVAIAGIFLLTTNGRLTGLERGELLGDIIVFLAGFVWGFYIVLTKQEIDRLDGKSAVPFLACVMAITALVTAFPMAIWGRFDAIGAANWALILYIAVFCTILAFLLWFIGLRTLSPTVSSIVLLLEPVFAMAFSIWLLHESFTALGLLGAFLILAAMALVVRES